MSQFALVLISSIAVYTTPSNGFQVQSSSWSLPRQQLLSSQSSSIHRRRLAERVVLHLAEGGSGQGFGDKEESDDIENVMAQRKKFAKETAKKAYSRMLEQEQDRKDDEIRAVKQLREVDQYLQEDPAASAIPEKVAQRMGARMLPFVGIPLFGGMGTFVAFWYSATYRDLEFEPALVAFSTIALLVVSLLGITYSVMSASWDAEREGSFVGWEEFQTNIENLKGGLERSKTNAGLRETMSRLSEEELEEEIKAMEMREEERKQRKTKENNSKKQRGAAAITAVMEEEDESEGPRKD